MTLPKTLARVASVVLHPAVMPVYCTLYALYFVSPWMALPSSVKTFLLLLIGCGACIIPLAIIGVLVLMGRVSDLEMPTREERFTPVTLTSITTGLCTTALLFNGLPYAIVVVVFAMSIISGIAAFITLYWKISLHGLGAGSLLSYVVVLGIQSRTDFFIPVAVAILVVGLSTWARLYLHAHRGVEVLAGFCLGAVVMACFLMI